MRRSLALVACLLLAGCGGFAGSTPDCTATPSPTPRAEPPVYVVIDNEQTRSLALDVRTTHLHANGSRTALFDSTVGLAPVQHLETRATFPSRDGRYRVHATADNATGRTTFGVPAGRLRRLLVHIVVHERDAPERVTIETTAQRPTPAC